MALADQAELAVRLSLDDRFSGQLGRAASSLGKFQGSVARAGKGVGQLAGGLLRVGAIATTAVGGGLVAVAKLGADFEAQLRIINTIAKEDSAGLTAIGDGLRGLAREGRGDLADLSAGYYDILSAGIAAADAQGVLDAATRLAIGGLSTNAQAVDLLTTAINSYGQEASAATADADLFAKAIEIGKVKADEIAASFANVAPVAAQTGINIEEIAAAYGALTAQGTPAAEVATQMQRAIVELLDPSKNLVNLQDKLGVSFLKIAQDKGLVVALQAMRDAVNDDESAFKGLFGRIEGYKFALQTTGPQQKIYNDALDAMRDSAGTAAGQMGERQQGLSFEVQRLTANLKDGALELSSGFLPALTRSISRLTKFLNTAGNRTELRKLGEDIGKFIDDINWEDVLSGAKSLVAVLKDAGSIAVGAVSILSKLPKEVLALGTVAIGANTVSGGLLGKGAANIVGGLTGAAARGIGAKIPGIGGVFATPVYVVNMAPGGMGGGLPAAAAGGKGVVGSALGALSVATLGAALTQAMFVGLPQFVASQPGFVPEKNVGPGSELDSTQILTRWADSYFPPSLKRGTPPQTGSGGNNVTRDLGLRADRNTSVTRDLFTETVKQTAILGDSRSEAFMHTRALDQVARESAANVAKTAAIGAAIASMPPPQVSVTVPVSVRTSISVRESQQVQRGFTMYRPPTTLNHL